MTSARVERRSMIPSRTLRLTFIVLAGLFMAVPIYLLVVNAFKPQAEIISTPFGFDLATLSFDYMARALTSTRFNVVAAYGVTIALVIGVNIISLIVSVPAAYVIARSLKRRYRVLMLVLLAGLFIPGQALIIPGIYVLKSLGLMGTIQGFLLFETTLTIPVSIFLYVGYIQTIPRELDEAAKIDGAGQLRTLLKVIVPLMKPAIATAIVLHSIGVWSDFVHPQMILGPASGIYTVTTGVYAAIGQYTSDYTLVYPNLLLAVAPILVFFIFMQRRIVGGLTSGALKG
ncbi:carbohydrate ABC transporter permease [Agromyces ramosus]|uniref:Raffinose/stachyose/melibiose transport system permease protein n=1 Tax=Agromyces ramosus TaxID=33879 RepID=A0ABU0RAQ3_9MICO|nr:carbohydrate ABC transporter permease [Agromyces ramosus]MDQ0895150.1 raffinose/stachyose/melibiose transport system permease protein [Agromyces ramosus]